VVEKKTVQATEAKCPSPTLRHTFIHTHKSFGGCEEFPFSWFIFWFASRKERMESMQYYAQDQ